MFLYEVCLFVLFVPLFSCDPAVNLTNQHFQRLKYKTLFNVNKRNVSGILQSPLPYVSIKVIGYHYAEFRDTRMNLHFGQCNLNLSCGFFGGTEQLFKIHDKEFKNPTYIEVQQAGITFKSKNAEPYDFHCDVDFREVSSVRPNFSLFVAVMAVEAVPIAIYYLNTSLYDESELSNNKNGLQIDESGITMGIVYCVVGVVGVLLLVIASAFSLGFSLKKFTSMKKKTNTRKKTSTQKRTSKSKTTTTKKKTATSKSKSKSKGPSKKSGTSKTTKKPSDKKKKKATKKGNKNKKKVAPKRQSKASAK
ncbi:hypothetical protein M3Y95_00414900 [Aphelenchoides besseyi]|nr:hypothetical protein M3Y95_00414900 [Aphelenchoides besseyi]